MIIKENMVITPFQLERTIHIYVPDHLEEDQRCKVVYMFDGHNLFNDEDATYGTSWGIKDYLDYHDEPIIIVGIECNHEGNDRLCEFSPYDFNDRVWGKVEGRGKALTKWIVDELKPTIDAKYPTLIQRENTAIAGSSMGGLMSIYVGMSASTTFGSAACLSPYLPYVYRRLYREIEKTDVTNTVFYISWGAFECNTHRRLAKYSEQVLSIARLLTKKRNFVYPHLYEYQDHSEGAWANETAIWMKEIGFMG
ncbi:alpha/beta hydrolase [Tannockella kyphosi]|uniref:alpha/beta hydrolase n=1 Tax=Tannockella kyphosi TaxID=2899121 RepID=UPI0020132329|nr:alpha/beta hydrolase-fold protein [Tannockella kyphosi]